VNTSSLESAPRSSAELDATEAATSVPERAENRIALPQGEAWTAAQAKRLTQWLPSRQNSMKQLWAGKGGRKLAIKMQCLDCMAEDIDAVRICGDCCCPLWHFRPFQRKTTTGRVAA
jgi:hypothetical protein